jgi:predicted nucleotidyltransferase
MYLWYKVPGMDQNLLKNRISRVIRDKDPRAVAYLFGSRARGDNKPDADWDILILVDDKKVTLDTEDKFIDDLYDLELESGQIISTFIYPKEYWQNTLIYSPFYKNIIREGIRL